MIDSEIIKSLASAIGVAAWPLVALLILFLFRKEFSKVVDRVSSRVADKGSSMSLCLGPAQIAIVPAEGLRPPSDEKEVGVRDKLTQDVKMVPEDKEGEMPLDYFFLNHTSFLRTKKQAEFRKITGVDLDHYDIRVIVDSYYREALERILCVEYILHRAYGKRSIQVRSDLQINSCLKSWRMANTSSWPRFISKIDRNQ